MFLPIAPHAIARIVREELPEVCPVGLLIEK